MYMYNWITFLYTWKVVNQLYFNLEQILYKLFTIKKKEKNQADKSFVTRKEERDTIPRVGLPGYCKVSVLPLIFEEIFGNGRR